MCSSSSHSTEQHQAKLVAARRRSARWRESVKLAGNARKGKTLIFADPEARAAAIKAALAKPSARERLSQARRRMWASRGGAQRAEIGAKIAASQKGRVFSPEHLANLRASNARSRTEEHRRKLGAAHIGKASWNAGLTKQTHPSLLSNSEKQKGRIPDYNRYRAWYEGQGGRIHMRSRWEVGYAHHLDSIHIGWQYEPYAFLVGTGPWSGTTYTPDFLLADGSYVEIKGRLTGENEAKLLRFREWHRDVRLSVMDAEELRKIGLVDRHRRLIPR